MEQKIKTETAAGRFGVVFLHVTEDVYEDLVGPTYETSDEATQAYLHAKRAGGYTGTLVQCQEDGTWLTLFSRQTPREWQQSTLAKMEGR